MGLLCGWFWPRFFRTPASSLWHGLLVLLPGTLCAFCFALLCFGFLLTAASQLFPDGAQELLGEEPRIGEVVVIYHPILRGGLGVANMPSKDCCFPFWKWILFCRSGWPETH